MDGAKAEERRPRRGGHQPSSPPLVALCRPVRPRSAPCGTRTCPGSNPPLPGQPVLDAGMKLAAVVMSPRRAEEAEGPPGSPACLV